MFAIEVIPVCVAFFLLRRITVASAEAIALKWPPYAREGKSLPPEWATQEPDKSKRAGSL
jgi:hypothetical protein